MIVCTLTLLTSRIRKCVVECGLPGQIKWLGRSTAYLFASKDLFKRIVLPFARELTVKLPFFYFLIIIHKGKGENRLCIKKSSSAAF